MTRNAPRSVCRNGQDCRKSLMWTSFYNGFHFRFFQLRLKTSFASQKHMYVTGLPKRELLLLYQHSSGVICPTQDKTWCSPFRTEVPYILLTYTAARLTASRADPDVFNRAQTHTEAGSSGKGRWQKLDNTVTAIPKNCRTYVYMCSCYWTHWKNSNKYKTEDCIMRFDTV